MAAQFTVACDMTDNQDRPVRAALRERKMVMDRIALRVQSLDSQYRDANLQLDQLISFSNEYSQSWRHELPAVAHKKIDNSLFQRRLQHNIGLLKERIAELDKLHASALVELSEAYQRTQVLERWLQQKSLDRQQKILSAEQRLCDEQSTKRTKLVGFGL